MSSNEYIFTNQIQVQDIPAMIELGHRIGRPCLGLGPAGIGKSQIISDYADKQYNGNHIDIRVSDKEPTDLSGIQIPVTQEDGSVKTVYAFVSFWPEDPNWEGIIILDEVLHGSPSMQHVCYQICLDRKIGDYEFPKGARICLAANRVFDNGAGYELLSPLANRLLIVEVAPNVEGWLEGYASEVGIHPAVVGLLRSNPEFFFTDPKNDEPSFCTARSWEAVSAVLYEMNKSIVSEKLGWIAVQGLIGSGPMIELKASYQLNGKLPSAFEILNGKVEKYESDEYEPSHMYMITQGCLTLMKEYMNKPENELSTDIFLDKVENYYNFLLNSFSEEVEMFVATVRKAQVAFVESKTRDKLGAKMASKKVVRDITMKYHGLGDCFE